MVKLDKKGSPSLGDPFLLMYSDDVKQQAFIY